MVLRVTMFMLTCTMMINISKHLPALNMIVVMVSVLLPEIIMVTPANVTRDMKVSNTSHVSHHFLVRFLRTCIIVIEGD